MKLKFWKRKAEIETDAAPSAPGLFTRIKAQAIALGGRFRPKPSFQAEVATEAPSETGDLPEQAAERLGLFARTKSAVMNMSYNQILIAGAVLLLLLLLAVGYAAWTIIRSSPDKNVNIADLVEKTPIHAPPIIPPGSAPAAASAVIASSVAASATSASSAASAPAIAHAVSAVPAPSEAKLPIAGAAQIAPASHPPQSELEMLRQKNAELQMQLDELKKAQQSSSTKVKLYPPDRRGAAAGGLATVGTSAPKATAATLKDAIEKMNSGTGDYRKKTAP